MKRAIVTLLTAVTCLPAFAADEVNIYSFRQPFLIQPILDDFTKQTGIKTKVVFAKKGLIERVKREGKHSRADLVLTSNFSAMIQLEDLGLTQKIDSKTVEANIPESFRDPEGQWVALTKRVRNVYSSKSRLGKLDSLSYEELADPKFKGKICTRSGKHPYNLGLVASMIAHHGEAETKEWLVGVKNNLARKPQGNDRAQVKAVKEGLCDVALGNSYYFGKMMTDAKQKSWADSVYINFPNQKNRGSHLNVSGVVLTKYAKNKENALKLIEFMSDNKAQNMYASTNMEYPVKPGVELSKMVASWGAFKEDSLPLAEISKYRPLALKLIDEVKFDL
ncbi:Fe(3+) ABC transporter substrate-binding protein [Pseudoalteromonas luteoviolacea]|uniref:Iron ABC transporter substrate-binding protein n=1 Tax=Pseudoalteromonas luteoviolacea DSM 6061 TaxID=1365250 RepID=A0A162AAR6_9GAMM|nr:Fe(3+) ABC transporter substrate-binding protein [Pseudoalteromonas luteoviolacea]KZN46803.1 iron ABC transporter substrate-binding protein [Pseudoalteromonas luteoviolacea DSM 6061]KZN50531.1 iron ABC transporter substrate-binding protein [Pseudoalteromonas luteoviolacea CPMOR-2]MBE0385011.1 iron(III) transport system substrate-binding protein [Pseudoalteromonas luteoviolacea DSM 6061]TQF69681.1 Fe(3+) ABC transporter substrate-binding protein [Pseudoalteromonas luteoviolacea]